MDATIFVAKVAGVIYLCVGLSALMNGSYMKKVIEDYVKSPGAVYLGAISAMLVGAVLLYNYSAWTADWKVLITIFGWGGMIKGAVALLWPEAMSKLMEWFLKLKYAFVYCGIFCTALGLVLGYFGFLA